MRKIRIGVTMGDPGGIGPEIILKMLCEPEITRKIDLCVIGHGRAFEDLSKTIGISPLFREESEPDTWTWRKAPFMVPLEEEDFVYNRAHPANGRLSIKALELAYDLVTSGYFDGIVTGPISKDAWRMAGMEDVGHTDFLATKTGQTAVLMMVGGRLRVSLVTGHLPLKDSINEITAERTAETIRITHAALISRFGIPEPRIGLAALNPHGGDNGLFGTEEETVLKPAMAMAEEDSIRVTGPVPADVLFRQALDDRYDAVVALYHDQGLIPVKLHDFMGAVNVTLGLPFIRTSPGHGVAFDIAQQGSADPRSIMAAVNMADTMARRILFP